MSKSLFTFQINSLPALERLLGGDSEAEVSLRQSAAAAFAENHLTGIITEEMAKSIRKSVAEVVTAAINAKRDELFSYDNAHRIQISDTLRDKICMAVEECAKNSIDSILSDTTKKAIERLTYERVDTIVCRTVEARYNMDIKELVAKGVQERLSYILNREKGV